MITEQEVERRVSLFNQGYWEVPDGLDTSEFDFTWRPSPYDRPYVHQFGTQHQKTGGPRFIIPENEGIKYQTHQRAIKLPDPESRCWRPLRNNCTIDFSWHPDETEPPFIYVFGNQWYDVDTMPTYQYRVKGATQKKYMHDMTATLLPDMERWVTPDEVDETVFDYSWIPHPHEPPFIWQFGTQWQKNGGPAYVAEGATFKKYSDKLRAIRKNNPEGRGWRPLKSNIEFDYSWHPDEDDPPYMYIFGNQWYDGELMPTVMYRVKGATEKKYVHDIKATLLPSKENFESLTDKDFDFDYSWVPHPKDPPYTYVFGNQWYDSITMPTLMYVTKGSLATKYIDDQKAILYPDRNNWYIPNNIDDSKFDYSWCPSPKEPDYIWQFGTQWQKTGGPRYIVKDATQVTYSSVQKVTKLPEPRNFRIIEAVSDFDYSWHPDDTEQPYTYVFGNEFFSAETMPTLIYKCKGSIGTKYLNEIKAKLSIETVYYENTIFDSVVKHSFSTKYAHFKNKNAIDVDYVEIIPNDENKVCVHILNPLEAIVPNDSKSKMYDKLQDFPYIKYHRTPYTDIKPLDIIFFSNGEKIADENYGYLLDLTKDLPNRVTRIDGVKGRVASQHAAGNASDTSWYFLVNAKLRVNKDFDFSWQPNLFKSNRHYIFTATNPVNGLEYGHQAIVANNKTLTLNTKVTGLDFTMDSPTEVLDINSGIGMYNTSTWDTWRTAFRECVKLCHYKDKIRLDAWLTGTGDFADDSIRGAKDAIEFYNSVNGELSKLMQTYDWEWLRARFLAR